MRKPWRVHDDPYLDVRFKLFGITIGSLLVIWATLLIIVYSLMARELYHVTDEQLRFSAAAVVHRYESGERPTTKAFILGDAHVTYSLWRLQPGKHGVTALFIGGNPFVDVQSLFNRANGSPFGTFATVRIDRESYRAYYWLVHAKRGRIIVRVIKPTATLDSTLGRLESTLTVAGLIALILTVAVSVLLTSRSIRPMIASWRRQQQFVADASHELRTPLAIIRANLDVLIRSPSHTIEEEFTHLGNAYAEAERTITLVDDLLTLARADSRQMLIARAQTDLCELVRDVVDAVLPLIEADDKRIICDLPDVPCEVLADAPRLRQLLLILVDNSVKHTRAGDVITIGVEADTLRTRLFVKDTGEGIPAHLLPHIFERFVRGDPSRSGEKRGTGLGLAIAKWIADAHGAAIAATSRPGSETVVMISFPG
jgi:two-component system sensor histidine kinase CiaH